MRAFRCPRCGQSLAFENSHCLNCDAQIGFALESVCFVLLRAANASGTPAYQRCGNTMLARCNWVVPADGTADLCQSCRLTRTRPADGDSVGLPEFADAEAAKRRLVVELAELGLPLTSRAREGTGVWFDLLSSAREAVTTGHDNGVITLDLAESNDAHREQLRASMDEPYRTLLGHFRHEIGHYFFPLLVTTTEDREEFASLFGDPEADYQAALDRHYSDGPPETWPETYISAYATMHPAEDWAETFAHYLHIRDTLDTAAAFGLAPSGITLDNPLPGRAGLDQLIAAWLPLTWALNMVNRSMGHRDLYPFVMSSTALDKVQLVHKLVGRGAQ